jgi:hypothetical protein
MSVWDTVATVISIRAITAITLGVTRSTIDGTVISRPEWVTNAVVVVIAVGVNDAVHTVARIRSGTSAITARAADNSGLCGRVVVVHWRGVRGVRCESWRLVTVVSIHSTIEASVVATVVAAIIAVVSGVSSIVASVSAIITIVATIEATIISAIDNIVALVPVVVLWLALVAIRKSIPVCVLVVGVVTLLVVSVHSLVQPFVASFSGVWVVALAHPHLEGGMDCALSAVVWTVSAYTLTFPATWVASLGLAVPMTTGWAFIARKTVTLSS